MKRPMELVRIFEELRRSAGEEPTLDDRTASDLDLDDVFRKIDGTASPAGSQCLYSRLRRPACDAEAAKAFGGLVDGLGLPQERSATVRRILSRLGGSNAYLLPYLFLGPLPEPPAAYVLAPALTLAAAGLTVAAFFTHAAVLAFVGLCLVNIVVRLAYRSRIATHLHSLPPLRALIRAGVALSGEGAGLPEGPRRRIAAAVQPLRALLRTTSWLALEDERAGESVRLFYEYVNLLFLLDVDAFLFSFGLLRTRRAAIHQLYETLGDVDTAMAVAEFRGTLPAWCRPRFTAAGTPLRVAAAVHPLLKAPVPNDLAVDGRGVLVTGSNMSGKTTFIKTVGLGVVLGATIDTCPAASFEGPLLAVSSAIGRTESLAEGASYYLAEVRRVRELVRAVEGDVPRLFLLDELFRGTNTVERIAGGKAVLSHLARGAHVTLVSTHDVELVPLLAGAYAPFHFRESVSDGTLAFDYRIRSGASSSRNAIALLASASFPAAVVEDALRTAEGLESRKT